MLAKLKSRKLWATVAAAALTALGSQIGAPPQLLETVVQLVMVYVGSQAVVDAASVMKK